METIFTALSWMLIFIVASMLSWSLMSICIVFEHNTKTQFNWKDFLIYPVVCISILTCFILQITSKDTGNLAIEPVFLGLSTIIPVILRLVFNKRINNQKFRVIIFIIFILLTFILFFLVKPIPEAF